MTDMIELAVFSSRVEAICEEMGVVLQRSAFSPNIKDRLDFSCALFDAQGELFAQAAHIPVHLGSMAYAMRDIVQRFAWRDGDMLVLNDPFLGGTHLPDVTLVAPLFRDGRLQAFVVNRAHHANIGASSPGSMPVTTNLDEEGVRLSPQFLIRDGRWQPAAMQQLQLIAASVAGPVDLALADFHAQVAANRVGLLRLGDLITSLQEKVFQGLVSALNNYAETLAKVALQRIPAGSYVFEDCMDDDGAGTENIAMKLTLIVEADRVVADFLGTAAQVSGNVNCPLSVTAAVAYYVFRCLMPAQTPVCAGAFRFLQLQAPLGCLVNAKYPAAVAAGNVETSSRLADLFLGALAQALPEIPAASQGTMNNVAMGSHDPENPWDYYETIGGGMGAGATYAGLSGVQSHMTNTLNTPIESLEMHYPIRIRRYALRTNSGGVGLNPGGDGLVREFEFLQPAQVTLLTERRSHQPWGLRGGSAGLAGCNWLNQDIVPAKCVAQVSSGDRLCIETPGGGGWGKLRASDTDTPRK